MFPSPLSQGIRGLNSRYHPFLIHATKVQLFSETTKYFGNFFRIILIKNLTTGTVPIAHNRDSPFCDTVRKESLLTTDDEKNIGVLRCPTCAHTFECEFKKISDILAILRNNAYLCAVNINTCIMTQLVITLKDQSYLPNIRRILKSLVGVEKVTTAKTDAKTAPRKKRLSRYEQSLLDVEEGRVYSYENSEEFFKKMGI